MRINRYMNVKVIEKFDQFVNRMWLDNCDENKAFGSITHTKEEYKEKYNDYLWKKFIKESIPDGRWNWYGAENGSNE